MVILGLTGSIGMGKSWGARCFRHLGVPVHDADACVHRLMASGGKAVASIENHFPGVKTAQGGIDRQKLAGHVLGQDENLDTLEAILHPLVHADQRRFLARMAAQGQSLAVLDIPLLYETQARARVDAVVVMSAPAWVQRQRVLRRPTMTAEKFEAILDRQTPDQQKRQLAEFIVTTGGPRGESLRQITNVVKVAKQLNGRAWSPHWGRTTATKEHIDA